jgi:NADPH-dependent curcumin reductase CurA
MTVTTRQWHLAAHPRGRPLEDGDLALATVTLPDPAPGEMLLRTRWLGFDPAQKGWMENVADYVAPMAIGDVMRGTAITEVVASNSGAFPVGTRLSGMTGWSEYVIHDGKGLTPVQEGISAGRSPATSCSSRARRVRRDRSSASLRRSRAAPRSESRAGRRNAPG